MLGTFKQAEAVANGAEDLSDFGRLASEYRRWKAGRPVSAAVRAFLEVTPQAQIDAALDFQRQMRRDDLRRRRDILVHGQRAISFYTALDALPPTPRPSARAPRRPGGASGRPRARAGRARRTATGRDDGSGEPPPALALAPKPRAIYTFGVLDRDRRGVGGPRQQAAHVPSTKKGRTQSSVLEQLRVREREREQRAELMSQLEEGER